MQNYDIIGDIHGYATKLKSLLELLGYRKNGGVYSHPERKIIFLGDYIDRGPEIRETLQIVRGMVERGSALAVMGNHEFNALAFHAPDGNGEYLRKHTPEKVDQHRATIEQLVTPSPDEWRDWLDWFATLPLFLDLGQLRAVHASWDATAVDTFRDIKKIDGPTLRSMADKKSPLGKYRELLLNGVELRLPTGHYFSDKSGFKRKDIRTRWWESLYGKTFRQAVFPDSDTVPDELIPASLTRGDLHYSADEPAVFFGHYWLPADSVKGPLALNVACLDYSVAKGGDLTAYRWDGEATLFSENFVTVENQPRN
jgi:hypothetical protein